MSHGELIGSQTGGESENLGTRLARLFRSPRSTGDPPAPPGGELQETVEFVPEGVEPAEGEWTPRFAMVWRGYDRLAVDDYTHSTAPNRRFPDLITQRLLKSALGAGPAPYGADELGTLAAHCTEQEGNAAKVERHVRKSAAALLLAKRIGQRFDAIVTGASDKGTWVRIFEPLAEGRVVKGSQGLDVGDRVRVELLHTDVPRGFIDFTVLR